MPHGQRCSTDLPLPGGLANRHEIFRHVARGSHQNIIKGITYFGANCAELSLLAVRLLGTQFIDPTSVLG